jgi:hypothetical protein
MESHVRELLERLRLRVPPALGRWPPPLRSASSSSASSKSASAAAAARSTASEIGLFGVAIDQPGRRPARRSRIVAGADLSAMRKVTAIVVGGR